MYSVIVPVLSVVVVVVSVTPLGWVATVVEDDVDVCAKATEPIMVVANAILTIDLITKTKLSNC